MLRVKHTNFFFFFPYSVSFGLLQWSQLTFEHHVLLATGKLGAEVLGALTCNSGDSHCCDGPLLGMELDILGQLPLATFPEEECPCREKLLVSAAP